MKIVGIDPGPVESAVVLFDGQKILHADEIASAGLTGFIVMAGCAVACEHLQCFGLAVGREVFETAYWIGEIRHCCAMNGLDFHRVYRSEEKMTLCQNMRAKDANIRQALLDRFGGKDVAIGKKAAPGPLYGVTGDMWSALAVAITWMEMSKAGST